MLKTGVASLLLLVVFTISIVGLITLSYQIMYNDEVDQTPLSRTFKNRKLSVVYLWVDGEDPEFQKRKGGSTKDNCRYADNGELEYSVAKTIQHMGPMLGNIYIVTQQQTPKWYDPKKHKNIFIVDHKEIMGDLVTFQSGVIELHLDNIKALKDEEWILYFNDDMSINEDVTWETFFYEDNKPRFAFDGWGFSPTFANLITFDQEYVSSALRHTEQLMRDKYPQMQGKNHRLRSHAPMPIHLPSYRKVKEDMSTEVTRTNLNTQRTRQDFLILYALIIYMVDHDLGKICSKHMVDYVFLNNSNEINQLQLQKAIGGSSTFVCINDSRTANFKQTTKYVRELLKKSAPAIDDFY